MQRPKTLRAETILLSSPFFRSRLPKMMLNGQARTTGLISGSGGNLGHDHIDG